MNSLTYLKNVRLKEELDKLTIAQINLATEHDGKFCKICNIIQGQSHNGFEKYYCEHLTKKIHRVLKKEKKEFSMKLIDSFVQENLLNA